MNTKPYSKRESRLKMYLLGFSLVELMVALVLSSVLLFLALPTFQDWIAQTRLSTQSITLRNLLSTARSEAIKRSEPVRLCNANVLGQTCESTSLQGVQNWNNGLLLFVDKNDNRQLDASTELLIKRIELEPSVQIQWNRGDSLSFLPTGRMDWGSNGTFTLTDNTRQETIKLVISIQGRVRMQD
jgi:type IV fimbrial biogenesis protein FimT